MSNVQRTPISRTLPIAAQRAALAEIEQRGYALPCHVTSVSGSIVTVAFDVLTKNGALPPVTMPIAGSEYIRLPVQVGMKGVAYPASVDISIATGLGPGSALPDISVLPANLAALVFVPVGNSSWSASPNADATVLYGASSGVIVQDKAGASPDSSITVNASGVTITVGSHTLQITSGGIYLDGVLWSTHDHSAGTYVAGSTPVTGTSGPVAG